MLTRFLNALRGRPTDGGADAGGAGGGAGAGAGGTHAAGADAGAPRAAGSAPEPPLPHPSLMVDEWRQQVARTVLALREQHPAPADAGGRTARVHAERLLVRIAVDLDMVVRQPPPAAQEALAVAGDPDCDLPALLRVVERDPAVTRGLMRHASSVMFAGSAPPASLDDAVRRLGARGVQVAVLAGMAEALLHGSGPYLQAAEAVWVHMVRVGPLARALAPGFGVPPDEAFLLGLLHDVGKLVLFDLLAAVRHELRRDVDLPPRLAADALRELHEPLGGLALLRWGVDPRAAWAVAHHHRRDPAVEGGLRSELLYVAEQLDAARARRRPVEVARWAAEGRLTTPPARVEAAVARAG
jgi:HD-like signal output (HDOD) protein